jgi:hypothetical protein
VTNERVKVHLIVRMASGSTYPPPPGYCKLCAEQDVKPPAPIAGTYTVFGETANSDVALPNLPGRNLTQQDADGTVGAKPFACIGMHIQVGGEVSQL